MLTIKAHNFISHFGVNDFGLSFVLERNGKNLANAILSKLEIDEETFEIKNIKDLCVNFYLIPASLLVSSFWHSFFCELKEKLPSYKYLIKNLTWQFNFQFQQDNFNMLFDRFQKEV